MRKTLTFSFGWGWPYAGFYKRNTIRQTEFTSTIIYLGKFRFHIRFVRS